MDSFQLRFAPVAKLNYRRALVDGPATKVLAVVQKADSVIDEEEADDIKSNEAEVTLVDDNIATPFLKNNFRSRGNDVLDDAGNPSRIDDDQFVFSQSTIPPHDRKLALVPSGEEKAAADRFISGKIRDIEAPKSKPEVVPGPHSKRSKGSPAPKLKVISSPSSKSTKDHSSQKPKSPESFVLSRHRRNFSEDLADERLTRTPDIETAFYAVVQRKEGSLTTSRHTLLEMVLEYYGFPVGYKTDPIDITMQCPFTSRNIEIGRTDIVGAKEYPTPFRLVPKELEGDELSYLFEVKDLLLDDPRNALLISGMVADALTSSRAVIIPVLGDARTNPSAFPPFHPIGLIPSTESILVPDESTISRTMFKLRFVCIARNPNPSKAAYFERWHNNEAMFPGTQRPALRFLYFRFLITYLNSLQEKKSKKVDWITDAELQGIIKVFTGPYLRKSMLVALVQQLCGRDLVGATFDATTFTESAEGSERRSKEKEKGLARTLKKRIVELFPKEHGQASKRVDLDCW